MIMTIDALQSSKTKNLIKILFNPKVIKIKILA